MIRGNCTDDENPDAWFPELPVGRPAPESMQALGNEVSRAIILCNSCHNQEACLKEGMEPKNLPYGIWGGKLAGERILMADRQGMEYMSKGRTTGALVNPDISERSGAGRLKGSVVIKESDSVTVEEKRSALSFLQRIKPWIKG